MAQPVAAQKAPYSFTVKAGRKYFWCACGRSKSQPFCDGSHAGTDIAPVVYAATAAEELWFCGCKATKSPPFCDGTHQSL